MELALFFASALFFAFGFPAPSLLVRLALGASRLLSPRTSLTLSGLCALSGALAALLSRGAARSAPAPARERLPLAAFGGGALGRALLLAFCARFPSSLPLARLQAAPLLLLCLLSLLPERASRPARTPPRPAAFRALCLLCGAAEGFLGAGGALLFSALWPPGIVRRRFSSSALALLLTVCAQAGALLAAGCAGASQDLPVRLAAALAAGAALGALVGEREKKRGPLGLRLALALRVYLLLCALAGVEQAVTG